MLLLTIHPLDAAHVLPILFSFTTPAKYCFRAMATFTRFVTGMLPKSESVGTIPMTLSPPMSPTLRAPSHERLLSADDIRLSRRSSELRSRSSPASREPSPRPRGGSLFALSGVNGGKKPEEVPSRRMSLRRAFSAQVSRAGILFKGGQQAGVGPTLTESPKESPKESPRESPPVSSRASPAPADAPERDNSEDVGGPRFYGSGMKGDDDTMRRAGEPSAYQNGLVSSSPGRWSVVVLTIRFRRAL